MRTASIRPAHRLFVTLLAFAALPAAAAAAADDSTLEKVTIVGDRTPDYRTAEVQVGPLRPSL